jgi:hypothetical protein
MKKGVNIQIGMFVAENNGESGKKDRRVGIMGGAR